MSEVSEKFVNKKESLCLKGDQMKATLLEQCKTIIFTQLVLTSIEIQTYDVLIYFHRFISIILVRV